MTTATVAKSASGRFGHNEQVDRMIGLFLSLAAKPNALEALSDAKIDAEHGLTEAETRYMDAQYRLAQLNAAAPESTGAEREAIDKERHDLRHMLEDLPTDIEHAARKVYEAENQIYATLSAIVDSEVSRAYQQALETKSDDDIGFHNTLRDRGNGARSVLRVHTSPADMASSRTDEIVQRYSTIQGIEREYKRRKHADQDREQFPTLVEESRVLNEAYSARQEARFEKISKLLDQAKDDAEISGNEHRRIAGMLAAIKRRGNTPIGIQIPGSHAPGDMDCILEIKDVIKRVLR